MTAFERTWTGRSGSRHKNVSITDTKINNKTCLTLYEYAFIIDASLLPSPYYFLEIFFFFFGMTKLLLYRKKCFWCSTSYFHGINLTKIKWFKLFRKPNIFYFLVENFMLTKNALDAYFSSWVWWKKLFSHE